MKIEVQYIKTYGIQWNHFIMINTYMKKQDKSQTI